MKLTLHTLVPALTLALSTILHQPSASFAQGSLTPPAGSPAPVMKTLDQIEARTPLVAGQPGVTLSPSGELTIAANGSYYLTGNLLSTNTTSSCITILTNHVTLDLNGYTISRTNGTDVGNAAIRIAADVTKMVVIRNGFINGGGTTLGFAYAILASTPGMALVENIHCNNVRNGIFLGGAGYASRVQASSVRDCGGGGISANTVTGCLVYNTLGDGIRAETVADSYVKLTAGNGIAIYAPDGCAMNSRATAYNGVGIASRSALNCMAESVGGGAALSTSTANNCTAARSGGTAIIATVANGCYATAGTNNITFKYNMP